MITDLEEYNAKREAVKEYYANLLILQYRNKPKARATIKLWVDLFLGDGLVFQLPDILDLDKAQGACLDIIGKILDCPRTIQGLVVDKKFFQFHQDSTSVGFSTVSTPRRGSFKSIQNSNLSAYDLNDDNYRILLKIKAISNVLTGTEGEIDKALYSTFGENATLVNNQDMTISYVIATDYPLAIEAGKLKGYFKSPCGVAIDSIIVVPISQNLYGFQMPMLIP